MTRNREIATTEGEGEVVILPPADIKALQLVTTVLEWMKENASYNWSEACAALGVARVSLYRALKRPVIQGMVSDWYLELTYAKAKLIHDTEIPILINMTKIAQSKRDPRAAVQAARFLHEVSKEVQVATTQGGEPEESEAARLLKRWLGGKAQVTLRQTRITQEVEVTDPDPG